MSSNLQSNIFLLPLMKKSLLLILICLSGTFTLICNNSFACNDVPLYEGCKKTKELLEIDQKFIEEAKKIKGGILKSADTLQDMGWTEISKNQPVEAIKRFNQLFLLEGKTSRVYWGLAVATAQREDYPLSDKLFIEAVALDGKNYRLICDAGYGKVQHALSLLRNSHTKETQAQTELDFKAAENFYQKALKAVPLSALPHTRLAELAFYRGNDKEARREAGESRKYGGEGLDPRLLKQLGIK